MLFFFHFLNLVLVYSKNVLFKLLLSKLNLREVLFLFVPNVLFMGLDFLLDFLLVLKNNLLDLMVDVLVPLLLIDFLGFIVVHYILLELL